MTGFAILQTRNGIRKRLRIAGLAGHEDFAVRADGPPPTEFLYADRERAEMDATFYWARHELDARFAQSRDLEVEPAEIVVVEVLGSAATPPP